MPVPLEVAARITLAASRGGTNWHVKPTERRGLIRRFRRVSKVEVHVLSLARHESAECARGAQWPYRFDLDHDGRREVLATYSCDPEEDFDLCWDFEEDSGNCDCSLCRADRKPTHCEPLKVSLLELLRAA